MPRPPKELPPENKILSDSGESNLDRTLFGCDDLRTREGCNDLELRFDLDIKEYHSLPHVSSSRERDYHRSKELYYGRYVSGHIPGFSSAQTAIGDDAHTALETKSLSHIVRAPSSKLTKTGRVGNEAKLWAEEQGIEGRLVSDTYYEQIESIWNSILSCDQAMEYSNQALHQEVSYLFKMGGLACRSRADIETESGLFVDLKTTSCGNIDRDFAKSVHEFGYGRQQAFYELAQACRNDGREVGMAFIVVQTVIPYQCRVLTLPREYVDLCKESVLKNLLEIEMHNTLGWNLKPAQAQREITLPAWMYGALKNE